MKEYPKIQTTWHRDPTTNHKTLIEGKWSEPEFEYLASNSWQFTEKVDGTNIRVMLADGKISFGGKTDNASLPSALITRLESRFHPQRDRMMEMFPAGACLYGEGYGARIQKGGGNYRPDQDFVLFDALVSDWWLTRESLADISDTLGLDLVPIIGSGTLLDMLGMAKQGFDSRWGKFLAEGIVARPSVELKTRSGHRIITKIKHRDFVGV